MTDMLWPDFRSAAPGRNPAVAFSLETEGGTARRNVCEPRVRSVSMSSGVPSVSGGILPAPFVSMLDPNSKPFSPRFSPRKNQENDVPNDCHEARWNRTSASNDSGCQSFDEKRSLEGSPVFHVEEPPSFRNGLAASPANIQKLVECKMKSEVEKFEEDEKLRSIWTQSGGGAVRRRSIVASPSSSTALPLVMPTQSLVGEVPKKVDCQAADDKESVFFPEVCKQLMFDAKTQQQQQKTAEEANGQQPNGRSSAEAPLLPTPEDFPPFGPTANNRPAAVGGELLARARPHGCGGVSRPGEDGSAADSFGLRSLVNSINQTAVGQLEHGREASSVMSMEDLGFSQGFLQHVQQQQQQHPPPHRGVAHQYVASPFDNRVVTPLADYNCVPPEYFHGNVTAKSGKLADVDLRRAPSDILFLLFYVAVEDILQLNAAYELFKRGWRYHKIMKIWLGFLPDHCAEVRTGVYERGRYQFFNVRTWTREVAEFKIYYEDVAGIGFPQDQCNFPAAARYPPSARQAQELESFRAQAAAAATAAAQRSFQMRGVPGVPVNNGRVHPQLYNSELKALIDRRQRDAALARALACGQLGQDQGMTAPGIEMPTTKY